MTTPLYQVDAFASELFSGNPAAVCPLRGWLPDEVLQAVATENNLSETAFLVPRGEDWELRWFTPTTEVDLCGHATLASAYAVFHELGHDGDCVRFHSKSGVLPVVREGDELVLDFPARPPLALAAPPALDIALGVEPLEVLGAAGICLARLEDEAAVAGLEPDLRALLELGDYGLCVTAPGDEVDFVSRFFAPAVGIAEDPVTGAAHCILTPYWSQRLGRAELRARQISARGGELRLEDRGERVAIAGRAVLYLRGAIAI